MPVCYLNSAASGPSPLCLLAVASVYYTITMSDNTDVIAEAKRIFDAISKADDELGQLLKKIGGADENDDRLMPIMQAGTSVQDSLTHLRPVIEQKTQKRIYVLQIRRYPIAPGKYRGDLNRRIWRDTRFKVTAARVNEENRNTERLKAAEMLYEWAADAGVDVSDSRIHGTTTWQRMHSEMMDFKADLKGYGHCDLCGKDVHKYSICPLA